MKYLDLPLSEWHLKRVDFQPLEDKIAAKLVTYSGKNFTTAGRTALVKPVITSQTIYQFIPLIVPHNVKNKYK